MPEQSTNEVPLLLLSAWAESISKYVRHRTAAYAIETSEDRKWKSLQTTAKTRRRRKPSR